MTGFAEIAQRVFVLRYPVLDVNVTLVAGDGAALLVDTLSTEAQARELAEAARRVTAGPWTIVNTHHHFDHCFGNAVLRAAGGGQPVWAHPATAALLAGRSGQLQQQWYAEWAETEPELAAGLAAVRVLPPDRTVTGAATLTVGGRTVLLRHLGAGHTTGDLVVQVPDADVLVAGDLVEVGAPPSFEDSHPLHWPETVAGLLQLAGPHTTVVPGHGPVTGREHLAGQQAELAALAAAIRDGHTAGAPAEAVAASAPFPAEAVLPAIRRGYAELAGSGPAAAGGGHPGLEPARHL